MCHPGNTDIQQKPLCSSPEFYLHPLLHSVPEAIIILNLAFITFMYSFHYANNKWALTMFQALFEGV